MLQGRYIIQLGDESYSGAVKVAEACTADGKEFFRDATRPCDIKRQEWSMDKVVAYYPLAEVTDAHWRIWDRTHELEGKLKDAEFKLRMAELRMAELRMAEKNNKDSKTEL